MIQLTVLLTVMSLFFGYIGFSRGWNKEIIATAGIILGLFGLFEFDDVINDLLANIPPDQQFYLRALAFSIIVYFAYHTRAIITESDRRRGDGRDDLQTSVLGGFVGVLNGYLIWGSMWYFLHITNYPLSPFITAPNPDSASANFIESLPLYVLAGGPGGDGNLLSAVMIVLFLIVLVVI